MTKWLLILPVSIRLYTSVIPWNPEIRTDKESWSTDMSPTTLFTPWDDPCTRGWTCPASVVGEGVYPGWWVWVGGREGAIPVPYPQPSRDPYLVIFKP